MQNYQLNARPDELRCVANRYGLRLLYVFGSTARGDRRAGSDVDFAYLAKNSLTSRQETSLSQALRKAFRLSGPMDLVDITHTSPLLGHSIATEGKKLYGEFRDDDIFYRNAQKRFIDAKPLFDLTAAYVNERLAV